MRLKLLITSVVALALAGAVVAAAPASAQGSPGPVQLTTGLLAPRGMEIGPDGMIYVAEAGVAGDIKLVVGGAETQSGYTGRISKIDPATGVRTTVVDKLPSNGGPEGDAVGPADVAFLNANLYYVQTHGGTAYGFTAAQPTGLYKVNVDDGTVSLLADIGQFNLDNPIDDVTNGVQQDIEIGGNPYAMDVRDGNFLVTDGNQNQVMQVTPEGDISRLAEFHGHPVTTGITYKTGGPLIVGGLGQFPFSPQDGNVFQVAYPTGTITEIADGFSSVTDVEYGPGGQLYALTFGDQATDPNGPPWGVFTAKILRVNSDGTMTPLVTGLNLATALIFDGDTAYVSNNSIEIPGVFSGEIVKIENFSSIQPLPTPAPQPTAAPVATPTRATGVTAPDTGTGPMGTDDTSLWLMALALGVAGVTMMGAALAYKRR